MALFGRETDREKQRAEAWARWFRRQHPFALASLVLGVFSLIEFGALIIIGVAGIVAGAIALVQLRRRTAFSIDREELQDHDDAPAARTEGRMLAWGGIVTSVLSLIVATLLYARVFG